MGNSPVMTRQHAVTNALLSSFLLLRSRTRSPSSSTATASAEPPSPQSQESAHHNEQSNQTPASTLRPMQNTATRLATYKNCSLPRPARTHRHVRRRRRLQMALTTPNHTSGQAKRLAPTISSRLAPGGGAGKVYDEMRVTSACVR